MTDKIIYDNITYDGSVNEIMSGDVVLGESLAASALSIDTLTVTVASDTAPVYHYAGVVQHYRGNTLMGKYYLKSIKRVGRTQYTLTAVSAIGLLDNITHYGGLYNGTGAIRNVGELFADIVRDTFPYTLDEAMADVFIYGWLPVDTARNNLRQLLFAVGASITKDDDYNPVISPLPSDVKTAIPTTRIFTGGSVDYPTPATAVVVTEHTYIPAEGDASEIYNGEVLDYDIVSPKGEAFAGQIITFNEPHYNYACTGAVILESGANYVVLAPSVNAVVTGQSYYHGQKEYRLAAEGSFDAEYVPTCNNCTLVSMANSRNVARRMLAYYSSHMDVTQDVSVIAERPGQRVTFTTPFGDSAEGYIKNMSLRFGQLLRGNVKFDTGYIPTGIGNYYDTFVLITQNGTFTIPEGVEHIRIVLVGGGQGGASGTSGAAGKVPDHTEQTSEQAYRYIAFADTGTITLNTDDTTEYEFYAAYGLNCVTGVFEPSPPIISTLAQMLSVLTSSYAIRYNGELYKYSSTSGSRVTFAKLTSEQRTRTREEYRVIFSGTTYGGKGGTGGIAGLGGKIYQADIDVTPGETITITVGSGGSGGTEGLGNYGGNTTAYVNGDTLTSDNGVRYKNGVMNILNGDIYGAEGVAGVNGGDGGVSDFPPVQSNGGDAGTAHGGYAGATFARSGGTSSSPYSSVFGGSGGGAAYLADGGNGTNAYESSRVPYYVISGDGGNGANAAVPTKPAEYGRGGHGGGGGGGGGNAGSVVVDTYILNPSYVRIGTAGAGGSGSNGGMGADGCAVIYYSSVN